MTSLSSDFGARELTLTEKLRGINWVLMLLICETACLGFAVLYSAADGNVQPWAATQMMRFAVALIPMIGAALLGIRFWLRAAYWAYALALLLIVAVLALQDFLTKGSLVYYVINWSTVTIGSLLILRVGETQVVRRVVDSTLSRSRSESQT